MAAHSSPLSVLDLLRKLLASSAPQPVSAAEIARTLDKLDRIARLMDAAIVIPGINRRAGLDAILGLIPGIGDFAGGAVSAYLVFEARRIGAPPALLARMIGNVAIDAAVGVVPGIGDLFDVAFKANVRNVALLRDHFARHGQGPVVDGDFVRRG
ncbi:MAG: DUF4112 domain-containing protein [Beijerinckiaceae bacterium]